MYFDRSKYSVTLVEKICGASSKIAERTTYSKKKKNLRQRLKKKFVKTKKIKKKIFIEKKKKKLEINKNE